MKIHWNPFDFIRETQASPHARTLRTDLAEKFNDTLTVLKGGSVDIDEYTKEMKIKLDVLDYLTLGIPTLSQILTKKLLDNLEDKNQKTPFLTKLFSGLFIVPIGLPTVLMLAAKFLGAGLLTFALSLLIVAVHKISQIKGEEYKKEAIKIYAQDPEHPTTDDYKRLGIAEISADIENESIKMQSITYSSTVKSLDDKTKSALMKLNIGNVLGKLEKEHPNHEIDVDQVKAKPNDIMYKK